MLNAPVCANIHRPNHPTILCINSRTQSSKWPIHSVSDTPIKLCHCTTQLPGVPKKTVQCLILYNSKTTKAISMKYIASYSERNNLDFDILHAYLNAILTVLLMFTFEG